MKAVILAGGCGTRLWPLSKKKQPKQFQSLVSNKTLFQEAVDRLDFLKKDDIYVALNKDHRNLASKQAPQIPGKNLIVEPDLRDTASCIGLAAVYIEKDHPEEVMAVIYADHLIKNREEFRKKLKTAEELSRKCHTLNIIEVKALSPNPHLGYVKLGKKAECVNGHAVFHLDKFVEKPDIRRAKRFILSQKYLWNTGYFVWRIKDILDAYKTHLPETYETLKKIQNDIGTKREEETLRKFYPTLQKISIDYGIMEKVAKERVRIIPANLEWSDIGNFETLFEELTDKNRSNVLKGKSINIETTSSLIYNFSKKTVATVGVKDCIIICTEDSILICPRDKSKDMKKLIEKLKKDSPELL